MRPFQDLGRSGLALPSVLPGEFCSARSAGCQAPWSPLSAAAQILDAVFAVVGGDAIKPRRQLGLAAEAIDGPKTVTKTSWATS